MKLVLYTTASSPWYQQRANIVAGRWGQTKGRGPVTIDVVKMKPPKQPKIVTDEKKAKRIDWEWFGKNWPKNDYDGVIVHFTPYYRKKWGIRGDKTKDGYRAINGSRNAYNQEFPQFWVCCSKEPAKGYNLSNFERLLYHEMAHFDEDLDNTTTDALNDASVHYWDYELKQIHIYHTLIDYRGYNIKKSLRELIIKVTNFIHDNLPTNSN